MDRGLGEVRCRRRRPEVQKVNRYNFIRYANRISVCFVSAPASFANNNSIFPSHLSPT